MVVVVVVMVVLTALLLVSRTSKALPGGAGIVGLMIGL